MPWRNETTEQAHDCRKSLPWLAPWIKEGMRWECGKKVEREGAKVPCGRLWEVVLDAAKDGTADMVKQWREVGGPDTPYARRLAELDSLDVTREAVEHQLYSARLGADADSKGTTQALAEMEIIRWTLDELERRGLAKWAHQ